MIIKLNLLTILSISLKNEQSIFMPFSFGGGIRSVDDAKLESSGADKIVINTLILNLRISLMNYKILGTQAVVASIVIKFIMEFQLFIQILKKLKKIYLKL